MEAPSQKRLGRYEIVAELGRGAMGVVYKARDPKIERFVAVKTISLAGQNPEEEREYRERFFCEAQAAGRLSHPGIVSVFDVGEEHETRDPYIVMEYIAGQNLHHWLSGENRKVAIETALQITEELAEALDFAHNQGVIHRDIKPSNILLAKDGHAKIADFGIAKLNLSHLTLPGQAWGSPGYMSPEQLEGEAVDGRSDLFSLGVILYLMVTGYAPFHGNSAVSVCFKIANREPMPATLLDPVLPPEVDSIIAQALAKDPAKRYQYGREFARDLRELRKRYPKEDSGNAGWPDESQPGNTPDELKAAFNKFYPISRTPRSTENAANRSRSSPEKAIGLVPHLQRHLKKLLVGSLVLILGLGWLGWRRRTSGGVGSPPAAVAARSSATKVADVSVETNSVRQPQEPVPPLRVSPAPPAPASRVSLGILIDHHFAKGTVSVWVDNQLAYSHALRGEKRKHLALFHRVEGHQSGAAQVPSGKHRLRVRVHSDDRDRSQTISASFSPGHPQTLRVSFEGQQDDIRVMLR